MIFETHSTKKIADRMVAITSATRFCRSSGGARCFSMASSTELMPMHSKMIRSHHLDSTPRITSRRIGLLMPMQNRECFAIFFGSFLGSFLPDLLSNLPSDILRIMYDLLSDLPSDLPLDLPAGRSSRTSISPKQATRLLPEEDLLNPAPSLSGPPIAGPETSTSASRASHLSGPPVAGPENSTIESEASTIESEASGFASSKASGFASSKAAAWGLSAAIYQATGHRPRRSQNSTRAH
mmetsp:Transcript_88810/g.287095  ORF Transcript_88810/g.287095 Transcript_88810/m.287095 type:complete len:239 (-) Transcript_88810:86-802(-)